MTEPAIILGDAELPRLGEDLDGLSDTWAIWPYGSYDGLARRLDEDRFVAVVPMLFTWAIIVGRVDTWAFHDDRWCYHHVGRAIAAASAWDGTGEPQGWHRHPGSDRRQ